MTRQLCVIVCGALLAACGSQTDALIADSAFIDDTLPMVLTERGGDAAAGEIVFIERDLGHCVLCHQIAGLEIASQGRIGPDLSDVGSRLTLAQLRLRIVDYQRVVPGALMPSYYRLDDLYQVAEPFRNQTILSAQQVEDLVAYLGNQQRDASPGE